MALYEDEFAGNPRTLCDWVKNFRIKKIQMKRKLRTGGNLRVCAILSTALLSAEHELRRKQQERFTRWLQMQARLNGKWEHHHHHHHPSYSEHDSASYGDGCADVDTVANAVTAADECRQRDEITNLWKCELSGLDEFMRNISNSSSNSRSTSVCVASGMNYANNLSITVAS